MFSLRKFQDSFDKTFKTFSEGLLPADEFQGYHIESFNSNIPRNKFENIRTNAIKCFKDVVSEEFKKLCVEFKVEKGLLDRHTYMNEQRNRPANSGWRPSGDPFIDTFGDRRPTQINHISNLRFLHAELENELKKLKNSLAKEHKILQTEVSSCNY